jgi:catechol 2,3-dioxygenase
MPGAPVAATLSAMTTIDPGAQIGHVHLHVADLDRALAFYRDVLGFQVRANLGRVGFLAAGDYHHHIGLNTFSGGGGLYHAAIRYPSRAALRTALQRVLAHGHEVSHGSDHGVNEAIYLADPDGNGLELYWDRPRAQWPAELVNRPLDVEALLRAA